MKLTLLFIAAVCVVSTSAGGIYNVVKAKTGQCTTQYLKSVEYEASGKDIAAAAKECGVSCDETVDCQGFLWKNKKVCRLYNATKCDGRKDTGKFYAKTGTTGPTTSPTVSPTVSPTSAPTNSPTTPSPTNPPTRPKGAYTETETNVQACNGTKVLGRKKFNSKTALSECENRCDINDRCGGFTLSGAYCQMFEETACHGKKGSNKYYVRTGDFVPTAPPTEAPTTSPTNAPTTSPTDAPTASPTRAVGTYTIHPQMQCAVTNANRVGSLKKIKNVAAANETCTAGCDKINNCQFIYYTGTSGKTCNYLSSCDSLKNSTKASRTVMSRDATAAPTGSPTTAEPTTPPPTDKPTEPTTDEPTTPPATDDPTASPTSAPGTEQPATQAPTAGDGLSGGEVGGIAVGAIAGIAIVALGANFLFAANKGSDAELPSKEQELSVNESNKAQVPSVPAV